jgi:hypothetical protein
MTSSITKLMGVGLPAQAAALLGFSTQLAQTATGTSSQANSLAVTANIVHVTTAAANSGVRLPPASRTDIDFVLVRNDGASTLNIYPSSGETINALSADTAATAATTVGRLFIRVSATKWVAVA